MPRYLVIAPQGLGDALQATPLVAALKQTDCTLDVAVLRSGPKALFEGLPEVRRVLYLPFWELGKVAFISELLRVRGTERYDTAFLTYPAARREYHVLTRAFPARRRIAHAYEEPAARNFLWLYSDLVPVRDAHNVERNLDLARRAGISPSTPYRHLVPREWLSRVPRDARTVAIHPGSVDHDGFALKRWSPGHFVSIGRGLAQDGYRISIIAGPDEVEVATRIAAEIPNAELFRGPLPSLAQHLGCATLLVSNDTGVAHLAAAVDTPVVALFGPTPVHCAPYGPHVTALRPSECPPCFTPKDGIAGCARDIGFACLTRDLTPQFVLGEVRRVLLAERAVS